MKYSQDYSFSKGRRGIAKDEKTFKITPVEGGAGLALAALFLSRNKKKTSNVKPPPSKPKTSNIQIPVGKPQKPRKPQMLKESSTFSKSARPGKKDKVKVQVLN